MQNKKIILFISRIVFCLIIIAIEYSCKKDENKDSNLASVNAPEFLTSDSVYILKANQARAKIYLKINEGCKYFYTLDESIPTVNSSFYKSDSAIQLTIGKHIVKVIAVLGIEKSNFTQRMFDITTLKQAEVEGIVTKTNYSKPVTIKLKNPDASTTYSVFLNNNPVDITSGLTVSEPYFYNLRIISTLESQSRTDSFLFVILDPTVSETEWGLHFWTPAPFKLDEITTETIETIYPKHFITGVNLPVILKTLENGAIKPLYVKMSNNVTSEIQHIKRGMGSYNLLCNNVLTSISITCGNKNLELPVNFENPTWVTMKGEVKSTEIAANSWIKITDNITVPKNDTLIINEGTIILVNQAININNFGRIEIKGTSANPIVLTCSLPEGNWGGFISKGVGNEIEISNAIICQSGYGTSSEYQWGHAGRQGLFYLEGTKFSATDCYLLDHIGQIFYPINANMTFKNSLVQRAQTGGQLNKSQVVIDNCIFTDFPNESYNFQDMDNDAIYISICDANISNSTFMFAKDDGINAGNGSETEDGGTINIDNCWIESTFHEGLALSSHGTRTQNISNTSVTNCGQGIELGFSVSTHVVTIDNCHVFKNGIGLRYGDNYTNEVAGTMHISNTRSEYNIDKDVWNMVRSIWAPKINNMDFINTTVSMPCEQYPFLYLSTSIPYVRLK